MRRLEDCVPPNKISVCQWEGRDSGQKVKDEMLWHSPQLASQDSWAQICQNVWDNYIFQFETNTLTSTRLPGFSSTNVSAFHPTSQSGFFGPKINVQSFVVCLRRPPERNIKGSSRRESLHLNINIKEEAFQGLENTPNLSCPCLLDMIMLW